MPGYKLIVKNAKVFLKTVTNAVLNISGIKDLLTGDGSVDSNNKINWTLQEYTNTSANFTSINPVLLLGQKGIETDDLLTTPKFKIGDGVTAWNSLPYVNSGGGSGVQSVTGANVDNTDPLNPIVNNLGLIQIVDLAGEFFTDLATARAYIQTFTSATITNESFSDGVYYFTVPAGSDFSNDSYFLSLGIFTPTSAYIIDSFGLITVFSDSLCLNNSGNNIFGNITCNGDSFNLSSGINTFNDVSSDTPSFVSSTGKFIFNGSVTATGIFLTDFFLTSTSTILTLASNFGNANFAQAASNGANVQYDGINLATVNNLDQIAVLASASISTTSTSALDLTEMNTTVLANTTYIIDGIISIGCNNTGGVSIKLDIPSGSLSLGLAGFTTSSSTVGWIKLNTSGILVGSYCRINSPSGIIYIKGTIDVGVTGGNLVWGFASVTGGQTSTVYKLGTQIRITKKV